MRILVSWCWPKQYDINVKKRGKLLLPNKNFRILAIWSHCSFGNLISDWEVILRHLTLLIVVEIRNNAEWSPTTRVCWRSFATGRAVWDENAAESLSAPLVGGIYCSAMSRKWITWSEMCIARVIKQAFSYLIRNIVSLLFKVKIYYC